MISLVRKNFLIAKFQTIFMAIFSVTVFPILYSRMSDSPVSEYILYFLLLVVSVVLINNGISIIETSNEKAVSYLVITPYGRVKYIVSKYIFDISIMIGLTFILIIEKMILSIGRKLDIRIILTLFIIVVIYRCFIIPIEVKYGYEKSKFIGMISVMLFPFALPYIFSNIDMTKLNLTFLEMSNSLLFVLGVMILVVIMVASCYVSVKLFKDKEL